MIPLIGCGRDRQRAHVMQEVLRHLIHGWQGFVGILSRATNEGQAIPQVELDRLERMQTELALVIANQKHLGAKSDV